ncbi:MAG: hypothetical protein HY334_08870, partial [Armatimonadetes bacterium]|nr:hypothetical protein [Armatimonadota bacterium]
NYIGTIGGDCTAGGNVTLAVGENKSCTITNDDVAQSTDVEIVSQESGTPGSCTPPAPSEIPFAQDTDVCLLKIIRNNGPLAIVDATVSLTAAFVPASGQEPDECSISPTQSTATVTSMPISVELTHIEAFVISCSQTGAHTFRFDNDIQPIGLTDTVPENNPATTFMTVDVSPALEPCPEFEVQFNDIIVDDKGTTSTSDDEFDWSYTVTSLDGPRCDLSYWVLSLCPDARSAFVAAAPQPAFVVDPDPNLGLSGVKWDDIESGFLSGGFTFTLNQPFPTEQVTAGFKTGAGTTFQSVEGPSCPPPPTATPTATATPAVLPVVTGPTETPGALPETGAGSGGTGSGLLVLLIVMGAVALGWAGIFTGIRRRTRP